jgi:hypothetical protein
LQVVVFDEQQLLDRTRDEFFGARQRLLQCRVITGFSSTENAPSCKPRSRGSSTEMM